MDAEAGPEIGVGWGQLIESSLRPCRRRRIPGLVEHLASPRGQGLDRIGAADRDRLAPEVDLVLEVGPLLDDYLVPIDGGIDRVLDLVVIPWNIERDRAPQTSMEQSQQKDRGQHAHDRPARADVADEADHR